MNIEQLVNEAIINNLTVVYAIEGLKGEYGIEVTKIVSEIASFAANDTTWSADDDVWSHSTTIDRLTAKYPFLTQAAKNKVADIAAYFWK